MEHGGFWTQMGSSRTFDTTGVVRSYLRELGGTTGSPRQGQGTPPGSFKG